MLQISIKKAKNTNPRQANNDKTPSRGENIFKDTLGLCNARQPSLFQVCDAHGIGDKQHITGHSIESVNQSVTMQSVIPIATANRAIGK